MICGIDCVDCFHNNVVSFIFLVIICLLSQHGLRIVYHINNQFNVGTSIEEGRRGGGGGGECDLINSVLEVLLGDNEVG